MLEENKIATVLKILSITVLIDNKIRPVEKKELSERIEYLKIFVAENTESGNNINIDSWCSTNWDSIQKNLNGNNRNEYVKKALEAITDEYLIQSMYISMSKICRCDNEFHETENELLKIAAEIWDLG
jgi:hypothetical protein